jgi:hypothetical protein
MFWCFHCYAVNDHPAGPCDVCGQPVEAPADLSYVEGLIWALHHPDGDRAVLAAETLGKLRARQAVPALRAVAGSGRDIYLRNAALRSVLAIEGAGSLGSWLEELSRCAPFSVRAIAQQALREVLHAQEPTARPADAG